MAMLESLNTSHKVVGLNNEQREGILNTEEAKMVRLFAIINRWLEDPLNLNQQDDVTTYQRNIAFHSAYSLYMYCTKHPAAQERAEVILAAHRRKMGIPAPIESSVEEDGSIAYG